MRPCHASNDAASPGATTDPAGRRTNPGGRQPGDAAAAAGPNTGRVVPLAQQVAFAQMLEEPFDDDAPDETEAKAGLLKNDAGAAKHESAGLLSRLSYSGLLAAISGRAATAERGSGMPPNAGHLAGQQGAVLSPSGDTSRSTGIPRIQAKCPAAVVRNVVQRIWVDAQSMGQRQVSMLMDERLLPATRVSVSEAGGAVDVAFECKQRETAELLGQDAPALARDVATALKRAVAFSVSVLPPEAPWSTRAFADAPHTGPLKSNPAADGVAVSAANKP